MAPPDAAPDQATDEREPEWPRPALSSVWHRAVDDLVLVGFRRRKPHRPEDQLTRVESETTAALKLYRELGWLDDPTLAHPEPPPPTVVEVAPARAGRTTYKAVTFASGYEPGVAEPAAERWNSFAANRTAHVWMLRHREPRPWIVCLHGAGMGRAIMDFGLFRAGWMHDTLGLNVAALVLPLHGPRRAEIPADAHFPSEDAMHNIHGARQAVWDARRLIAWIRTQGDEPVGVIGVSLGGYIAALLGGLADGLRTVMLGAPVADLTALIEHHKGSALPHEKANIALARQLGPVVSPLAFAPRVPFDGRFIYAGVVDKMVNPRHHAERIWNHWGRPEALWYQGGHADLGWAKVIGRFIERNLDEVEMTRRRPAETPD